MAMFLRLRFYGQMSSQNEFQLHNMFCALDIDPTTLNLNTCTKHHKSTQT